MRAHDRHRADRSALPPLRAFFALRDLLLERTGCCPNFEVLLAQEWTFVLLEEATAADHAQVLRRGALGRAP